MMVAQDEKNPNLTRIVLNAVETKPILESELGKFKSYCEELEGKVPKCGPSNVPVNNVSRGAIISSNQLSSGTRSAISTNGASNPGAQQEGRGVITSVNQEGNSSSQPRKGKEKKSVFRFFRK